MYGESKSLTLQIEVCTHTGLDQVGAQKESLLSKPWLSDTSSIVINDRCGSVFARIRMNNSDSMTIPKQLHVTLKLEREYSSLKFKEIPLGFAHDYTPHLKAFAKKRDTQMTWAYGAYTEDPDGTLWYEPEQKVENGTYVYEFVGPGRRPVYEPAVRVPSHLYPRIIDNDPIDGFVIAHSVDRSSTSNKVWRIRDPRGFELEISTGCMEDLIMNGSIIHGVIQGKCVWHTGKILRYA